MNNLYPVFTIESECLDCYKCVRVCPVKAIRITDSHASVIPEKCIACGTCISVCPQKAKKVRNDTEKVREMLLSDKKVYASIAPSWKGLIPGNRSQLSSALLKLGFDGVSETALGAQEVSIQTASVLRRREKNLWISSACPAVVDYIRKYLPEFSENIMPLASPALTHGKMLKDQFGDEINVVFIGPCAAKKNESDYAPDLIDAALGFDELMEMLYIDGISISDQSSQEEASIEEMAHEGVLYPMEGGMNETIAMAGNVRDVRLISISTIQSIHDQLKDLDRQTITEPLFIEALACKGGCLNGPCTVSCKPGLNVIADIFKSINVRKPIPEIPKTVVTLNYRPDVKTECPPTPEQIRTAMLRIGKCSIDDELNCGGCGYNTCRELGMALASKNAEPHMCSSYMRKIATRKAGAVFNCMPSGIVMVDKDLRIIETNKSFVQMFARDIYDGFDEYPDCLEGARLERVIPCVELFESALETNKKIHKEHYPINKNLYDISLFSVEPHQIIGAVIADVTKYEMRRDQIAKKAQSVISKNIAIVQEIACSLGEHIVETELLLTSIAEGYKSERQEDTESGQEKMVFLNGLGSKYE
jgi:iron only hydrogenase large subunit-like protein